MKKYKNPKSNKIVLAAQTTPAGEIDMFTVEWPKGWLEAVMKFTGLSAEEIIAEVEFRVRDRYKAAIMETNQRSEQGQDMRLPILVIPNLAINVETILERRERLAALRKAGLGTHLNDG